MLLSPPPTAVYFLLSESRKENLLSILTSLRNRLRLFYGFIHALCELESGLDATLAYVCVLDQVH
jgi:hypothetical protein